MAKRRKPKPIAPELREGIEVQTMLLSDGRWAWRVVETAVLAIAVHPCKSEAMAIQHAHAAFGGHIAGSQCNSHAAMPRASEAQGDG
jgi:hypothetical protein